MSRAGDRNRTIPMMERRTRIVIALWYGGVRSAQAPKTSGFLMKIHSHTHDQIIYCYLVFPKTTRDASFLYGDAKSIVPMPYSAKVLT